MIWSPIRLLILFTLWVSFLFAQESFSLEDSRALFQDTVAREENRQKELLISAQKAYADELEGLALQAQQAGQLDALLRIRGEQEKAREGTLEPLADNAPAPLRAARQRFEAGQQSIETESQANRERLRRSYLAHLGQLQRSLTVNNRIEEALAVRAEIQRLQGVAEPVSEPAALAPAHPQVILGWSRGQGDPQAFGQVEPKALLAIGRQVRHLDIQHEGDIRITPRGWECAGGRSVIAGAGDALLEAFKATHELTLSVSLVTGSLDQRGPARILSFSKDTTNRNMTLGQEGGKLVLRLRTPENGNNGSNTAIDLGDIAAGKPLRLVLTYKDGEARLYRDGKVVETNRIRGDFRNWEPMAFMVGNEVGNERAWRGILHRFELYNRALDAETARRLSATP